MTRLARLGELGTDVVWHVPAHRLRLLEISRVTGDTSGGKPLELPDRRALMTVFALQGCVRSQQREAVLVILDLLHGDIPALNGVTLRTIRAHLSLVHVDMTVLAIFPDIGENGFHVALRALHFFMHTA